MLKQVDRFHLGRFHLSSQKFIFVFAAFLFLSLFSCKQKSSTEGPKYRKSQKTNDKPVYHFAILPINNPIMSLKVYGPMINYLNIHLPDIDLKLEASSDFVKFEDKYKSRKPDFLLVNPWQVLQAIKVGYNVIGEVGESADFKGLIIVRKDGGVKVPTDLKGKFVCYPAPTAFAACVMPQFFLHQNGVNVNTDIKNLYVGSQESSILNVYLKRTAAGGTFPPAWHRFLKEKPAQASQLKVMWETTSLVNLAIMVREDVPENIKLKVQKLLIELHTTKIGQSILHRMEVNRIYKVTNKDYQIVQTYTTKFENEVRKIDEK